MWKDWSARAESPTRSGTDERRRTIWFACVAEQSAGESRDRKKGLNKKRKVEGYWEGEWGVAAMINSAMLYIQREPDCCLDSRKWMCLLSISLYTNTANLIIQWITIDLVVYLPICLSTHLSNHLSTHLYEGLSTYLLNYIILATHLSTVSSVHLSFYPSTYITI